MEDLALACFFFGAPMSATTQGMDRIERASQINRGPSQVDKRALSGWQRSLSIRMRAFSDWHKGPLGWIEGQYNWAPDSMFFSLFLFSSFLFFTIGSKGPRFS